MIQYYYLNEDHTYTPCDLMTWANQIEALSKQHKKHVAHNIVADKQVSTVWLGVDHNHFSDIDNSLPLLFETMVFEGNNVNNIYMDRYTTWEEAEIGHLRAIQWVKEGCKNDE